MQNWKTTLFGAVAIVLGFLGPVLNHYFPVVGLDWVTVCTTMATFAAGGGLLAAKDYSTHSTVAQVQASSAVVNAVTPSQAEQAKAALEQANQAVAVKKP